jgi:threonine/homoserine efflux transporter RhtA
MYTFTETKKIPITMLQKEEIKTLLLWFVIPEETTMLRIIFSKVLLLEIKKPAISRLWRQEETPVM